MPRRTRRAAALLPLAALLGGCALQADAQELIARERDLAHRLRAGDAAALEALVAEEFRLTYVDPGSAPAVVGRDEWLESPAWPQGLVSLGSARPTVESIGEGLFAVEVELVHERATEDGRIEVRRERVTDLWVRRAGRWQLQGRVRLTPANGG